MFCEKCGTELKDNAKFCHKCGAKVPEKIVKPGDNVKPVPEHKDQPVNDSSATEIISPVRAVDQTDYQPTEILMTPASGSASVNGSDAASDLKQATEQLFEENAGSEENTKDKKEKKPKKKALLTILLILIVLILAGVLTYLFVPGVNESVSRMFTGKASEESSDDESDQEEKEEKKSKKKSVEEELEEAEEETTEEVDVENKVFTGKRKPVDIQVRQVDNTNFPEVTLYANILDESGNTVEDIVNEDLSVKEIGKDGKLIDASISEVYRLLDQDKISINLVMDQSDSMNYDDRMQQAKNAAKGLVDKMELAHGDQVEIISFDSYVYLKQEFTSQGSLLYSSIDGISPDGMTALFDALYAGLYQTNMETGAKCVIGFTDGMENSSSYSYDDVVYLSRNTGIPVYIIGIGDDYDATLLQSLAADCSGHYYSASNSNLESILEDIYIQIYEEQQDYYVVRYKTSDTSDVHDFREVVLETTDTSQYEVTYTKEYVPEADVSGAFGDYANKDFMIDDSSSRAVTDSDLAGMSLAELRIARNEIYARHGRQFKDPLLNQWFYSKAWYLNVGRKYSPSDFDAIRPSPLSTLELSNANYILEYEKDKMEREDIYPNAAAIELSEYDLALSKPVLRKALSQLNGYSSTAILEENKKKIEEALAQSEVTY